MQTFLETDRLTLRRFTEADEDNPFELNSDPEVMRFLNGGKPTPRDEVRTRIIPAFLGYYERFEGLASGRQWRPRPVSSWASVAISMGRAEHSPAAVAGHLHASRRPDPSGHLRASCP